MLLRDFLDGLYEHKKIFVMSYTKNIREVIRKSIREVIYKKYYEDV